MAWNETTYVLERLAYGNVPGATAVNIRGYNGSVTSSYETLWDESNAYTFLTAAMSAPYIASTDANDTSAGTGARTVRATLINTSFVQSTEDLTMNGQTSVVLTTTNVLAVQKIEILTAGSGGTNAGIIRIGTGANTGGAPAVVHGHMAASTGLSRHGFYVVPAANILLVRGLRFASGSATAGAITAGIKQAVGLTGLVEEVFTQMGTNNDCIKPDLSIPLAFAATSKLNFQLIASAGTGPASVLASCALIDTSNLAFAKWI